MLGLLALYFIGKSFYTLAEYHKKNKWGFAFAGLGVYFGGNVLLVLMIAIFYVEFLDSGSFLLDIIGMLIGAISAVLFYSHLKKKWENDTKFSNNVEILDDML